MEYIYSDGYETVNKEEAFKIFQDGKDVQIGYQKKDDGAWWSFSQFEDKAKGITNKDKFESIIKHVKTCVLPHTRIKYAILKTK